MHGPRVGAPPDLAGATPPKPADRAALRKLVTALAGKI
jgi:hypothetical protein